MSILLPDWSIQINAGLKNLPFISLRSISRQEPSLKVEVFAIYNRNYGRRNRMF